MQVITEIPKILIVYDYHPKETFATKVGEHLLHNISIPGVRVVKYDLEPDKGNSTRNLRLFIEQFDPFIPSIILHSDIKFGSYAAIIYHARSKQERRRVRKFLVDFLSLKKNTIAFGRFLTPNSRYSFIDIELGTRMGLGKAVSLTETFSKYLISIYPERIFEP